VAVLGTGCGSTADTTTTSTAPAAAPGVAFITYRPEEGDQPLADGQLTLVLDDGCIWIEAAPGEKRLFALWPETWTAETTDNSIEIHRPDGTVVPFGVPLLFSTSAISHETAAALVTTPIPMRCIDYLEALVFDVVPATSG